MTFVILDLEATCWEKGTRPGRMETIEFGAVKLAPGSGEVLGEFESFVRPSERPELSEFCRTLTSIRQEEVDAAPPFPEVLASFVAWVGGDPATLVTWGAYDPRQIRVDCRRHELPEPAILQHHVNLKVLYSEVHQCRRCGMAQALRHLGIPLDGTHHRGIDDARNIAKIARLVLPELGASGEPSAGGSP